MHRSLTEFLYLQAPVPASRCPQAPVASQASPESQDPHLHRAFSFDSSPADCQNDQAERLWALSVPEMDLVVGFVLGPALDLGAVAAVAAAGAHWQRWMLQDPGYCQKYWLQVQAARQLEQRYYLLLVQSSAAVAVRYCRTSWEMGSLLIVGTAVLLVLD